MRERGIASQLARYAVLAGGQALIGWGIAEGAKRLAEVQEKRRRAKTKVGFTVQMQHAKVDAAEIARLVREKLESSSDRRRC